MGVVKNFPYGRTPPILRSSGESLSSISHSTPPTPPSETEETAEVQIGQRNRVVNRRRRDPALLIQRLEALNRKRTGARKARREDNARALQTLVEDDDNGSVCKASYEDIVHPSETPMSKLVTDFKSMRIWEYFMSQTEEEQKKYLDDASQNKDNCRNSAAYGIYFKRTDNCASGEEKTKNGKSTLSAQERFSSIDSSLRGVLKHRNMPNGLLLNLEEDLRSVFIRDASAVYLSRELSSFERLLLHAICQYYLLKSCSITVSGSRRTRVKNKNDTFLQPSSTLSTFLEDRKKILNRS
ncbi:UNVERIFIED_CONTAM: hypothetical protein RMT77_000070 [Armadillidium vulgare]